MPVGELIAEVVVRPILEVIFYGLGYWIGYLVLSMLSFGQLKLAPLKSIDQENRKKKGGISIWLHRPMQGRALKAEVVCFTGLLLLAGMACCVYFFIMDIEESENKSKLDDHSTPREYFIEFQVSMK